MQPRADDQPVKLLDLNGEPGADWTSEQLAWIP